MTSAFVFSYLCLNLATVPEPPSASTASANGPQIETVEAPIDPELTVTLGLELFTSYRYVATESESEAHAFSLDRGHVLTGLAYKGISANVMMEAVASATGGAIFGVAEQSVLLRVRQAYAGYTDGTWFDIRAGIVPTLTAPALQRAWQTRVISAVSPRRTKLLDPADFGANIRIHLPLQLGWLGLGVYNGDGYTAREFNNNKSVEATLLLRPFATLADDLPLWLTAGFIYGSTGPANVRADRLVASLAWASSAVGVGATVTYAWGVSDHGGRESLLASGWLRGNPWRGLLLVARVSHWLRDADVKTDTISRFTGAVGYRVLRPLEVFISGEYNLPGDAFSSAAPYDNGWSVGLRVRVALTGQFSMNASEQREPTVSSTRADR